jgi:hypothetical protein
MTDHTSEVSLSTSMFMTAADLDQAKVSIYGDVTNVELSAYPIQVSVMRPNDDVSRAEWVDAFGRLADRIAQAVETFEEHDGRAHVVSRRDGAELEVRTDG